MTRGSLLRRPRRWPTATARPGSRWCWSIPHGSTAGLATRLLNEDCGRTSRPASGRCSTQRGQASRVPRWASSRTGVRTLAGGVGARSPRMRLRLACATLRTAGISDSRHRGARLAANSVHRRGLLQTSCRAPAAHGLETRTAAASCCRGRVGAPHRSARWSPPTTAAAYGLLEAALATRVGPVFLDVATHARPDCSTWLRRPRLQSAATLRAHGPRRGTALAGGAPVNSSSPARNLVERA